VNPCIPPTGLCNLMETCKTLQCHIVQRLTPYMHWSENCTGAIRAEYRGSLPLPAAGLYFNYQVGSGELAKFSMRRTGPDVPKAMVDT
jgi:hypothetical protein